ncbi:hypothetical protein POTOM_024075 [Populus tomentosa]|uniref:Histidine-containing phosphotransfer protein n=1 Tax=Populus tomentosa TaxID=118781 RepID=A0A8X8D022_POPTO|nr:hypothetical protein POTOM_024075 [Populus tomentosa]
MDVRKQLQHQVAYTRRSLFDQVLYTLFAMHELGYLDDQFIQLEHLQDEANPNFVEEVVRLFYSDSVRLIQNIEQAMINKPNVDFGKLDAFMHQFKVYLREIINDLQHRSYEGDEGMLKVQGILLCRKHRRMHQDISAAQARACHFEEEARDLLSAGKTSWSSSRECLK